MFAIVGDPVDYVKNAIPELFTTSIEKVEEFRGELTLYVKPEQLRTVCEAIKQHLDLDFDHLPDLTAVDHLKEMQEGEPRFHVVIHLFSTFRKKRIRLKVPVWEDNCAVDSVADIWTSANWHERECYDLFGITFNGHPDLRRIMMPDDWEGHPLRKDYPVSNQEPYEYINKQLASE
ncbi:MAG: NADH-quinone oxidoreductase subunit C [Candidatus Hinthialibacter antarcticus]|nr:NADH-quinone oxidoreductase subunit C [Candidatus Hinthialibacter antarcticus]